jgi:hypothetical protein
MSIKVTKKLDVIIMSPFAFLIRVYSEAVEKMVKNIDISPI